MNFINYYQKELGILPKVVEFVEWAHNSIINNFNEINSISEYHQARILKCMGDCRISLRHFNPSTGYGYGDESRDTLDKLFALVFGGEDALVRPHWVSGTHVISDSLFAMLRPGDTMLSLTGKPYDTLDQVIGIGEIAGNNSLKDLGIKYIQAELTPDGKINHEEISSIIKNRKIKLFFIQRSRGYDWRSSLSIKEIEETIKLIKAVQPEALVLVDDCYGEFTEALEPCHVGADLMVGSLIKNPGGGIAPTGAYAVGTEYAIEQLSYRMTSPSIGREVGSYALSYVPFFQGLFMAPHIVAEAIKGTMLAAKIFHTLGYEVSPEWNKPRSDIIQAIQFRTPEELISFCQAIQSASPIDSHVIPYPWDMPGYNHQIIMAAGTFIQGSSIELSADAPIREPYIAYMQGGLTYSHVKIALMKVLNQLIKGNIIDL